MQMMYHYLCKNAGLLKLEDYLADYYEIAAFKFSPINVGALLKYFQKSSVLWVASSSWVTLGYVWKFVVYYIGLYILSGRRRPNEGFLGKHRF